MADGLAHATNLAVPALVDDDAQDARLQFTNFCRRSDTVTDLDAIAKRGQGMSGNALVGAVDMSHVFLLHAEFRVCQSMCQLAVIGEEQESFGLRVQSPDGIHAWRVGNQVDHSLSFVGVLCRGDDASGFVQQVIDEIGPNTDRCPIHLDDVMAHVDPLTQAGEVTIDRDATRFDHLLAHAARTPASRGEHFLESLPFRGRLVRHACSTSGVACGTMRSPCSSASTTRASGTNSAIEDNASIDSSPSRSRNSDVVPYSTA